MPRDTYGCAHALARPAGRCHKETVRRLRDFAAIRDFFSEREIDELQAAAYARRATRLGRSRPEVAGDKGVP